MTIPFDRLIPLLLLWLLLPASIPAAEVEPLDKIVAIVDEDVIMRSELDAEITTIKAKLQEKGAPIPPDDVLQRQVMDRLIMKKLQLAAAARSGIQVGEDILAQAIGNIARNAGLTMSQFRQVLQDGGISFRHYREGIRQQIIIQQLLQKEVLQRIKVTDQEVKVFLAHQGNKIKGRAAYRLRHILIATPEGASADELQAAREKAQRLVEELRAGRDFAAAAMAESDGQQALSGGDLGWRKTKELPTLFAEQASSMERGDISDPIHTSSGYHIIKVEDYKGGDRHIINQTHVRHILIKTNEVTSEEDARSRLQQLKLRIEGGDDFAALARANSDDKGSAIEGGDLGWVTPGDLVPSFETEIASLAPGEISEPFRTDFGWHIAQVLERRQHDSTEEVQKAEARKAIRERKFQEERELFLRRLRDEAYIVKKLDDE